MQHTIFDVIINLKNEKGFISDNWKGDVADMYIQTLDTYITQTSCIEKSLENINCEMNRMWSIFNNDNADSVKLYAAKKL